MANKEHLARLQRVMAATYRWRPEKHQQVVTAWNQWRKANPHVIPDLSGADLHSAPLNGVDLHRTDLALADLGSASLSKATLAGARLREARLEGAHFTDANLCKASLAQADLTGANLTRANLTGARLVRARMTEAILSGTNFREAEMAATVLANVNLRLAQGLEAVVHHGPSSIGIDTLYRSHGNIPEVFLRGAGVPDDVITYSKSLVGQPFQSYSCFISYASRDEALAQRLHADLQANKVRCWFAPENLKIGDEFRSRIDESIQVCDRLLLILSESSVKSRWVQKEVETAFEKEGKENRIVLFPIRIDEAVMQSAVGWAADIRRQRHIGDFRQWKDHDAYQQAFNRLLRDLKAEI
jgi:hypothetical protein